MSFFLPHAIRTVTCDVQATKMSTIRSPSARRFFLLFHEIATSKAPRCVQRTSQGSVATPTLRRAFAHTPHYRQTEARKPPTHYDLFKESLSAGPPPKGPFAVDVAKLKKEFLQLQARAHPDKHAAADKRRAEGLSAQINEAYKTLQDPLRRAQYLLSLQGIELAEDEAAKVEDPALLGEVLEAREAIEEAESEEDLEPLQEVNEVRIGESLVALEDAFASGDLETAKQEAVRLRYWSNIKESLHNWEKGEPVVLVH